MEKEQEANTGSPVPDNPKAIPRTPTPDPRQTEQSDIAELIKEHQARVRAKRVKPGP